MKVVIRYARALGTAAAAVLVLGACSRGAPSVAGVPRDVTDAATAVVHLEPGFDPTAAAGGGVNSANAVSTGEVKTAFASVPQIDRLRLTANSSPPGAKAGEVTSVSVVGQDGDGLLKGLDATAKHSLAEALLTAAAAAWPNASVSLLVSDTAGAGGQIIGSRAKGGPNTVIVA